MNYSFYKKENLKYDQAFVITADAEKELQTKGIEGWYHGFMQPFNPNTTNPLEKAFVWMDQNYYSNLKGKWILDAGCGLGWWAMKMESRDNTVVGIDMYKCKIQFAQKFKEYFPMKKFSFYEGSIYRMPFHPKWFDICHSCSVIEHLTTPFSGVIVMGASAREVTGIIHMGPNPEESPLHTYFYDDRKVVEILDWCFDNYRVDYIYDDKGNYIFALFIATPKKMVPSPNEICSQIFGAPLSIVDIQAEYIPMENIDVLPPMMPELVDNYVACLEEGGIELFENPILPIILVQSPLELDPNRYRLFGDGTHRINALKKYGKIEKIRAMVLTVQESIYD